MYLFYLHLNLKENYIITSLNRLVSSRVLGQKLDRILFLYVIIARATIRSHKQVMQ